MSAFDAIVLGADVEGLAAAAHLARAGRKVLCLDALAHAGGAAAAEELAPGRRASLLLEAGGARRDLLAPLALERHGLSWDERSPVQLVLGGRARARWSPAGDAAGAPVHDDPREAQAAERWSAFHARLAPLVKAVLDDAPPALAALDAGQLVHLASRGLELRRLGETDFHTLLRALTLPASDWTYQWFASEELRTAATAGGLPGSRLGPRAAGTAALSLLRSCALGPEPRGGPAALAEALLAACRAQGVELALGRAPRRLLLDAGGASGVETSAGSHAAPLVLSCLGPRATRALFEPRHVPEALGRAAERWRARGAVSVLHVALARPPALDGATRFLAARSLEQLERCADALKYGALPEDPWLDARVDAAPDGTAVLTIHVHGTCRGLRGGWSDAARERLLASVWRALDAVLPGLRASATAERLTTPDALEERHGLPGGHLWGGELALDQLWVQRPSLALARYATGLPGLFLGGASQHPGGHAHGGAGSLAAREMLRARR